jgi:hypothetical protein
MKKTLLILTALLGAGADSALADTVELRNGRVIHGKVIGKLPASGPVTVTVTVTFTGGGSLTLDPGSILSVRRDTRCDFKVSPGKPGNEKLRRKVQESAGGKPGTSPKKPEEKKKPVKEAEESAGTGGAPVDPKLEAEIRRYVSELSRQRSQNRVRAEAALKRLGPVTLPYLEKAARHPFALTRRAIIRIVAETGGPEGVKLLRAALKDEDSWVRKLAREALGG